MTPAELVDEVTTYYLTSRDFNGLPGYAVVPDKGLDLDALRHILIPLVGDETLSANFGTVHVNPHIRAFPDLPVGEQIALLQAASGAGFVIYPTPKTLAARVNAADYEGKPFTLRLARGEPQLSFVIFDLAVLDSYRRDPRYRLWTDDIQATLSIGNEAYESTTFPEKHKVLIQHFGFAYNERGDRAVAVFLTDLSRLTPEHQQIWNAWTIEGGHKLHPDYYKSAIEGAWGLGISLREAFMVELRTINHMCAAIGWSPLFREVPDEAPPALAFLLRPAGHEYDEFLLTLDKLLSDNINRDFFPASIDRETRCTREDGSVVVTQRGTLAMLEEWVSSSFRLRDDPELLDSMFKGFREVRKLRQQPAHSLKANEYDPGLFAEQRELFNRAYSALRTLRMMLANHPATRKVSSAMDQRVYTGNIWSR